MHRGTVSVGQNSNPERITAHEKFLSGGQSLFSFFGNSDFDSLLSWEGDQSLFTPSDDENVAQSGGE